jgi:signal transduction histidine kinase/CheY-like chemotaxis protein
MSDRPATRPRVVSYALTGGALCAGFLLLRGSAWQGGVHLHTLMEVLATVLAAIIGAMALVRYYSKRDVLFLFVGAGFLGTAFLDGYHAVLTSEWFAQSFASPHDRLVPWSWIASRLFLSCALFAGWWVCRREARVGGARPISPFAVYCIAGGFTGICFLFFAFVPLPGAIQDGWLFPRPQEFVPALLFLAALIGFWRRGNWRHDPFEHWLMLALIVSFMGEAAFMSSSARLYDGMFDAAHLLKKASYGCVLVGLLIGMFFLFRRAAESAEQVRAQNAELERRVAERTAELRRANARLEEMNRVKSEFLASMSHELRTPLNAIIGFSEIMKDGLAGELTPEQRGFTADIFDAGTHLLSLINDILDLSKVEGGMMQLELEPVHVAPLLGAALTIIKEKAARQRIALELEAEPGLPEIAADARKLKQITCNLLSNAVKFTPDGGNVVLRARCVGRAAVALAPGRPGRLLPLPAGEHARFIEISVRDSGVGIAGADLARLFEPFVQLDSSLARRQSGTGLGLGLIRRLAELHGGTVGVASAPGEGSTFTVWIPCRVPAAPEKGSAPVYARPAPAAEPATIEALSAAPRLALVVEDDDAAAKLLSDHLRAEGFEVMRAATGEEGLVRAEKSRPQLITLDVFLPAMDGWEFLRRLRANPDLACIPVVIVSISRDAEHGLALGAARVLQKPYVQAELAQALKGLVPGDASGARARVLVVDDNPQAIDLLATHLAEQPVELLRAYSGAEALQVVRRTRIHLVILDLLMPGTSGFEVLAELKRSAATAAIPVLVVTAKDLTPDDRERLNGGALAIMRKQRFDGAQFRAEVRRTLARRDGGGEHGG